jgi:hypothetical protein
MPGGAAAGYALIQAVIGQATFGPVFLLLNATHSFARQHQQQIIGATGLMQEFGAGHQQPCQMKQHAQTAMIMIVTGYGIMTLIPGEEEELLLTEIITALLA